MKTPRTEKHKNYLNLIKYAGSHGTQICVPYNDRLPAAQTCIGQEFFHDHVIRTAESLEDIRAYVKNTPLNWVLDEENPVNRTTQIERCKE